VVIQGAIKIEVPCETVFPFGALVLGVDKKVDFDKRGTGDDQARDKETGERVWVVRVTDLDPEAAKPGRTSEVKVKIVAPVQPVPPKRQHPHVPPAVVFEGITLTPYVDSARCNGSSARCRGRQAYSIRATGMRAPSQADFAAVLDREAAAGGGDG
jgi:hypothetical protein